MSSPKVVEVVEAAAVEEVEVVVVEEVVEAVAVEAAIGAAVGRLLGLLLPKTNPVSNAGNYRFPPGSQGYTKGGYGSFGAPPPYSQANTRGSFTNYPQSYAGGYGPGSRAGWVGAYNPSLLYWAIVPSFFFLGYHHMYHRYNSNSGAYYAPQMTASGGNGEVIINGTEYTSSEDNYHYTFNITTNNVLPIVDHAYYASSDPAAHPADFVYRLTFANIIEFDDANQNGFLDANEHILAITSLQNAQWSPMSLANKTVPSNSTLSYYETSASSSVTYNNTGATTGNQTFNVQLTWRSTNLQINNTAPLTLQPNSLQYDFAVSGYPKSANSRIALTQVLTLKPDTGVWFDVNMTTPVDVANQIKTNETYGISVGGYSEGRLEYQPTVNITDATQVPSTWTTLDPVQINQLSYNSPNDWIWGDVTADKRKAKLLFISMPYQSADNTVNNSTQGSKVNARISGFGFLNTDVLNAGAGGSSGGSPVGVPVGSLGSTIRLSIALITVSLFFTMM
ncbi:uncharacterized protein BYT42DRAFT_615624 [Radiomyces spectabilis]|uniref:uncharacterized protein n=1 Tax=Radiomyces spectabilis TaxID=64574 RepID=UPI002220BBDF|nr:uncharacterized protein BYT42DRAFT_615624 [Radiomyces spectabilis]KAI8374463.1 hypothetical protein BYT42DRAFT_615624 [Radiomyces spectabilis]